MPAEKPVILLAYANEKGNNSRFLNQLDDEMNNLDDILQEKFFTVPKPSATRARIEKAFGIHRDKIVIFHFGGHASGEGIQTAETDSDDNFAYVSGLADYVGLQKGVRLVFLNGCSTEKQVAYFHKANIPAVIATTRPLNDTVGREFAQHFYTSLTEGRTISESFAEADAKLRNKYQSYQHLYRSIGRKKLSPKELEEFPYKLNINPKYSEVANEGIANWMIDSPKPMNTLMASVRPTGVGQKAYLLCDRIEQNDTFTDDFKFRLNGNFDKPQFYFIHGPHSELPNSLADRFFEFSIKRIFESEGERLNPSRFQKYKVRMPGKADFEHANKNKPDFRVQESFKEAFKVRNVSAENILNQVSRQFKVIFIQHDIMAKDWHKSTPVFIQKYTREFWNLRITAQMPYVVVLFNITYVEPKKSLFSFLKSDPDSGIQKDLHLIADNRDNCTVLKKLEPVLKDDIIKWGYDFLPDVEQLADQICENRTELSMNLVQPKLREALKEYSERNART